MSNSIHTVPNKLDQMRLDRVLQELTGLSRKKIKLMLDQGRIKVNKRKVIIASWTIQKGDHVQVIDDEKAPVVSADEYFLKTVFEDEHLLVVEKDPGVPCEESPTSTRPTLVAIINVYLKRRYPHHKHFYLGLVHRLDKDTSGLMVYSKTKDANAIISQFKNHSIRRRYLALVHGKVAKQEGQIDNFLKKSDLLPGGKKVTISEGDSGQRALTHYRVIERYPNASLLEITLNTGRTHQIRVHMASIGHPVIGDKVYGKEVKKDSSITFNRQALHASHLGFFHPVTNVKMMFDSELPKDLRKLVDKCRVRSS